MNSENAKEWLEAMKSEIQSLKSQNTWKLTTPPKNRKVIRGRWVFKVKTNADNSI